MHIKLFPNVRYISMNTNTLATYLNRINYTGRGYFEIDFPFPGAKVRLIY